MRHFISCVQKCPKKNIKNILGMIVAKLFLIYKYFYLFINNGGF